MGSFEHTDLSVLTDGATAYEEVENEYDEDPKWSDPKVMKHLRLKLVSGPPIPYLQYDYGDNRVPVKSVEAMECPEDWESNATIYGTSWPVICFDTTKIDPIQTTYMGEDLEFYRKTSWFFIIEECRDKPENECASPDEIKQFVETHIIWSGEYSRYVNVHD